MKPERQETNGNRVSTQDVIGTAQRKTAEPVRNGGPAVSQYQTLCLDCFDSRQSPQQAAELRIDVTRPQVAIDNLSVLVDEQHRRQEMDAQGIGQRAVEATGLVSCGQDSELSFR